jgi:hypothetical protein
MIKAIEVRNYYQPSLQDFITKNTSNTSYKKKVITTLVNRTLYNFKTTNLKVDYLNMAQAYFKRAIFSTVIFVLLIGISIIYSNKYSNNASNRGNAILPGGYTIVGGYLSR